MSSLDSSKPQTDPQNRPPSVDSLARSLMASSGLPQPVCVDIARQAISDSPSADLIQGRAEELAAVFVERGFQEVVNATGVLLHTNLGRSPWAVSRSAKYSNLEFDLTTGQRGSRQVHVSDLFSKLCGAEAAMAVNNCSAAVLLATAALAEQRSVVISRSELVEIGGGFRIPQVIEQSGARLVEVGTTNKTRIKDYEKALKKNSDIALCLKVHQSNYKMTGFVESVEVRELSDLGIPLLADLGSGLLDSACPWLDGAPPKWLEGEPGARQTLEAGADLVSFSCDKLLGGPQAGIIAGKKDLVDLCAAHPLARAFRPGDIILAALLDLAEHYLNREGMKIPFWEMAVRTQDALRERAESVAAQCESQTESQTNISIAEMTSAVGGGTLPGVEIPSMGISVEGDVSEKLRRHSPPVIARVADQKTHLDFRTIFADEDEAVVSALKSLSAKTP